MLWLLEPDVFGAGAHPLTEAVHRAGHRVLGWRDDWWSASENLPPATSERVVFHGSLANAARIAELGRWRPGAYCTTAHFACSAWYPRAREWLANQSYAFSTVRDLVADPEGVASRLGVTSARIFVRPDSPLKPFSGRVVPLAGLAPSHLDHGFYYDDLDLPIVVAQEASFGAEWRFIVAAGQVVASSAYDPVGHRPVGSAVPMEPRRLAEEIAEQLSAPDPIYVLDLVDTPSGPRLLELNPFSGASLYDCNLDDIVAAVDHLP